MTGRLLVVGTGVVAAEQVEEELIVVEVVVFLESQQKPFLASIKLLLKLALLLLLLLVQGDAVSWWWWPWLQPKEVEEEGVGDLGEVAFPPTAWLIEEKYSVRAETTIFQL